MQLKIDMECKMFLEVGVSGDNQRVNGCHNVGCRYYSHIQSIGAWYCKLQYLFTFEIKYCTEIQLFANKGR